MFGLGWGELLIIAAVICVIAGPAALPKIVKSVQSLNKVKSDLTGGNVIQKFLLDDEPDPETRSADDPSDS